MENGNQESFPILISNGMKLLFISISRFSNIKNWNEKGNKLTIIPYHKILRFTKEKIIYLNNYFTWSNNKLHN